MLFIADGRFHMESAMIANPKLRKCMLEMKPFVQLLLAIRCIPIQPL